MEFIIEEQTVTLDESTLVAPPHEVGEWMVEAALRVWYTYNDEGNFTHKVRRCKCAKNEASFTLTDPDEEKTVRFTADDFFRKHVELIWLGTITNYRHDWINFAFKSHDAPADEYDDCTVDAVLQNMLYGEVVYG